MKNSHFSWVDNSSCLTSVIGHPAYPRPCITNGSYALYLPPQQREFHENCCGWVSLSLSSAATMPLPSVMHCAATVDDGALSGTTPPQQSAAAVLGLRPSWLIQVQRQWVNGARLQLPSPLFLFLLPQVLLLVLQKRHMPTTLTSISNFTHMVSKTGGPNPIHERKPWKGRQESEIFSWSMADRISLMESPHLSKSTKIAQQEK